MLKMKKLTKYLIIVLTVVLFAGCDKFFNPGSDDTLLEKDYIGKFTELYSGYMGITAKVQAVADKAIFIEGLRSDLLEPTVNAPQDIWDIYNYSENLNNNDLADPKGYYAVVMNANDYIVHAIEYKKKNPNALPEATYNALIGGAIRYKVWAYLMLAKIYGEAYYFSDPVKEFQDITKFPKPDLNGIIDSCLSLMNNGVQGINGMGTVKWSVLLFPGQNVTSTETQWDRICPTPESLLAELYLWKGDYQQCWKYCVDQIVAGRLDGSNYLLSLSEYGAEWVNCFRGFIRQEHVAAAFYDYELKQTNRVIKYFSNKAPNLYYLRPTQVARNRFTVQKNDEGSFGDYYRGDNKTYKYEAGDYGTDWVLWKFVSDAHSSSEKIYKSNLIIPLYRATDIHLMLIEALGGLNRFVEAYHIINKGFIIGASAWNGTSFNAPFDLYPATIYTSSNEGYMQGIRGRVSTGSNHLSNVADSVIKSKVMSDDQKHYLLDSAMVEEICLESAGESRSYFAMIRAARRWGADARKLYASKVAAKYPGGGEAIKAKLEADINNWFIKYDLSK
jgi:hypothetical protein